MSVQFKVTLFAAVAVGLIAIMGVALWRVCQQGQDFMRQVQALEAQEERSHTLEASAFEPPRETERAMAEALRQERARALRFNQRLGVVAPLVSLVIMLGLAAAILRPMHRSFQALVKGAERIGQGQLDHVITVQDRGEFSTLAQAVNQMATQLQLNARQREEYLKREAQTRELELYRNHAVLEEMVRMRNTELENSNHQLKLSVQRLKAVQDQLLFAERLATIGQIAAGIGHEINNPLAYILSNLNYAQEELRRTQGSLSEQECQEVQAALAETRDGAERVRLIVEDFKRMVSPDSIDRSPLELAPVVRTAVKMAQHELRNRAQVVEQLDGIPPIYGNGPRLGQVFLNLLINAAHAITPGQVERNTVKIAARVSGSDYVVVEVSDTGCGISPENTKRIFDPFFTTKPLGKGSGLGLSVCHSILIAHGGEISVESEEGKGTTFRLILPLYTGKHLPTPPLGSVLNTMRLGQ